jgi:hypothetical protein
MMAAWLSFAAATAGFGMLSLTLQRHARAAPGVGARLGGRHGKAMLRVLGGLALVASGFVALYENLQLGAIYWCGYLLAAALLVTAIHTWLEN